MRAKDELKHHTKTMTTATKSSQKFWVRVRRAGDIFPIRRRNRCLYEVVASETCPRQDPANPTTKGETPHACTRYDAARDRQSMLRGLHVDIRPARTAFDAHLKGLTV